MKSIREQLEPFGIQTADILIPNSSVDPSKWSVIACDQFSSERGYWDSVRAEVGDAPSTLQLIFPECDLNSGRDDAVIQHINATMKDYLNRSLFQTVSNAFILVKRTFRSGKIRWGLMAALDLECYDFRPNSDSLIRATEGTVLERIPPRLKIREGAPLELPHILVLVDDSRAPLLEPLKRSVRRATPLYHTSLMQNSGSCTGYAVTDPKRLRRFVKSMAKIADRKAFAEKYGDRPPLWFAVGDGNHSLATAKSQWEALKPTLPPDARAHHPARYALVELNSVYDNGIVFEPIHRLILHADANRFLADCAQRFSLEVETVTSPSAPAELAASIPNEQQFILLSADGAKRVRFTAPDKNLTVGTLQPFVDDWLRSQPNSSIDYIHGVESIEKLARQPDTFGIILPNISKSAFFETVIRDGAFPRKTFSMGEAHEKRFYFEARIIRPEAAAATPPTRP